MTVTVRGLIRSAGRPGLVPISQLRQHWFILMFELAYREILLIEHTEGSNVNHESAKQYIRMALNVLPCRDNILSLVLREAMDTARRVLYALSTMHWHRWKRVEPLGGCDFSYLETIANITVSSNCRDDRRYPSNGASAYGRIWFIHIVAVWAEVTDEYLEVFMCSIQKEYPWCGMCDHLYPALTRSLSLTGYTI